MTDFNKMTTEELSENIEILMRRFEETTDRKTLLVLAGTIGRMEKIRDLKSW